MYMYIYIIDYNDTIINDEKYLAIIATLWRKLVV